jgi:hypothetical protein
MESDFPEDLYRLQRWADEAVKSAWALWNAKDSKRLNAAREILIELLCNPPEILDGLCRELVIESDKDRVGPGVDRTRFASVPAKHPYIWDMGDGVFQTHKGIAPYSVVREVDYLSRIRLNRSEDLSQAQELEIPLQVKYKFDLFHAKE